MDGMIFSTRTIKAPVYGSPACQVIGDIDIFSLAPGNNGAMGLLARGNNIKPSQIVEGFQKMSKLKGSSVEKMPRQVAKLLEIDYNEFSHYLHEIKKLEQRGGADNFTWHELIELGKEFKKSN